MKKPWWAKKWETKLDSGNVFLTFEVNKAGLVYFVLKNLIGRINNACRTLKKL